MHTLQAIELSDFHFEHIPVQEQERVERLRLCGGSDVASGCQMIHERRDALCAEFPRMPLVMEQDVTTNPEPVRLFNTPAQVSSSAERGTRPRARRAAPGGGVAITRMNGGYRAN